MTNPPVRKRTGGFFIHTLRYRILFHLFETLAFFHAFLYNKFRPICAGRAQRYFHAHSAN